MFSPGLTFPPRVGGVQLGPHAPKKGVGVNLAAFMAAQSDGFWYDFSKTARLWQENPPVTPADDPGESIGLVFDARTGAGPWATNLCTWSQDISNAAWTKTDITVGATTTAPDGTSTAALATAGSAGTDTLASPLAVVVASSTNTIRIRLKKSGSPWLRLVFADATGTDGFNQWVDLTNGVLGTSTIRGAGTKTSATMTTDAFGFYLITLRGVVSTRTYLNLLIVSASADGSVTRVNGATYYPWGCEIVAGSYSGAYIPTTSIPVTAPGKQAVQATGSFKPTEQTGGAKGDATDDRFATIFTSSSGDAFNVYPAAVIPATLAATQVFAGAMDGSANGDYLAVTTGGALRAKVGATTLDSTGIDLRGGTHDLAYWTSGATLYLYADGAIVASGPWTGSRPTTAWNLFALNNNGAASNFTGATMKAALRGAQALTVSLANQICRAA